MENQQPQSTNELCRSGCGFFGSATTEGLCSKCYKDRAAREDVLPSLSQSSSSKISTSSSTVADVEANVKKVVTTCQQIKSSEITQKLLDNLTTADVICPKLESVDLASSPSTSKKIEEPLIQDKDDTPNEPLTPVKKSKNRCHECNKKVGLTGFECRCGGLYCGNHRYDKAHNCAHDYKTIEREQLAKNNPACDFSKIEKI